MGNKAPVVTTSVSSLSYTAGLFGAVAIDAVITVSDADNANLVGATVTVSGNYAGGQDVLGFTNQNGITGSWNAATGVLSLSGIATKANYQAALRSVTYDNTSANPSTLTRTVSIVADDGASANRLSAPATRAIVVTFGFVDLTGIFGIAWTLPATVIASQPVKGTASVVVKNIGNMPLPTGQKVNIQLVAQDTTNPLNAPIVLDTLSNQ